MKLEKLKPWNWFKKEDEERGDLVPFRGRNPDHSLSQFHHEFDRLLTDFLGGDRGAPFPYLPSYFRSRNGTAGDSFMPHLDVSTLDDHYEIDIEVPGAEKDDIKVEHQDGVLMIHGEKRHEHTDRKKDFYRMERSYGSFRRTLNLPPDADSDHLEARFKNGVLKLTIPRVEVAEEHHPRVVEIKD